MRDVIQRRKLQICLVAILTLIVTALTVSPVFADDEEIDDSIKGIFEQYENSGAAKNEYVFDGATTRYFNVEIKVNKDYSYEITETIDVLFKSGKSKHGITRIIPLAGNYRIKDISVEGDDYDIGKDNGNLNIKIGDAYRYVTGEKVYKIKYKIENYLQSNVENHLYVDIIPTNWQMKIMSSNATVKLPEDFPYTGMKSYTGKYGSTEQYGTWEYDKNSNTLNYKASMIPSNYGVTLLANTPKNYWVGAHSKGWSNPLNVLILSFCIIFILLMRLKSSSKSKDIVSPVTFNPPDGITPAEIGYLVDEVVDREDVVSLYLYLASKGYIKIEEGEDKNDTTITSIKVPENEPDFVNEFYKALFESLDNESIGRKCNIEDAGKEIGESYNKIRANIEWNFKGEKAIYSKASESLENFAIKIGCIGFFATALLAAYRSSVILDFDILSIIGILVFSIPVMAIWAFLFKYLRKKIIYIKSKNVAKGTAGIVFSGILYMAYLIGFDVLIYFTGKDDTPIYIYPAIMIYALILPFLIIGIRKRSDYNRKMYGEILGFRNFIETAEVDKINELVEENPSYFYDILPYAYVFKLTDKWVKKFENIKMPEHSSYTSQRADAFDYMWVNMMMNSIESSTYSGISAASPDIGGGGFSSSGGGGFSGGGAGGGGGGTW